MNGKQTKKLRRIARKQATRIPLASDEIYKATKAAFKEVKRGRS